MAPSQGSEPRPLRADARDNRRRLLEAARDGFIDRGPGVSLEEIARRAGTGIATLDRRFPDRRTLIRDVVLDPVRRTAEGPDGRPGKSPTRSPPWPGICTGPSTCASAP